MPANKNQHFVPRCHLKPFSLGGEGIAINVYNGRSDRGISNAPVKGQCSKDYFYGKDLRIEKALHAIEGQYATFIKRVTNAPDEVAFEDLKSVRDFAYLQLSRTEMAVKRRSEAIGGMDEIAHRGFQGMRRDALNVSREKMVRDALKTFSETVKNIADLDILLIRNRTAPDFVTSDDPAILTNRLFMQRLGDQSFGLVSAGTILTMPLTPRLAILCYDRGAYAAPDRNGPWLDFTKERDVIALNDLQYISCNANVYFSNWAELDFIRDEFRAASPRRPKDWTKFWVGVLVKEDKNAEIYRRASEAEMESRATKIIGFSQIYPNPTRWFGGLVYRTKVFGFKNGSAVGFIREGQVNFFGKGNVFRKEEIKFRGAYSDDGPRTMLLRKGNGE